MEYSYGLPKRLGGNKEQIHLSYNTYKIPNLIERNQRLRYHKIDFQLVHLFVYG